MIDYREWPFPARDCRAVEEAFRGIPEVDIMLCRSAVETGQDLYSLATFVLESMRHTMPEEDWYARWRRLNAIGAVASKQ